MQRSFELNGSRWEGEEKGRRKGQQAISEHGKEKGGKTQKQKWEREVGFLRGVLMIVGRAGGLHVGGSAVGRVVGGADTCMGERHKQARAHTHTHIYNWPILGRVDVPFSCFRLIEIKQHHGLTQDSSHIIPAQKRNNSPSHLCCSLIHPMFIHPSINQPDHFASRIQPQTSDTQNFGLESRPCALGLSYSPHQCPHTKLSMTTCCNQHAKPFFFSFFSSTMPTGETYGQRTAQIQSKRLQWPWETQQPTRIAVDHQILSL